MPKRQSRDLTRRDSPLPMRLITDALRPIPRSRKQRLALAARAHVGDELAVVFAEREGDRLERAAVRDPAQDQLGLKQRREAVGGRIAPAAASLRKVLQARDHVQLLPAGFGDERRQVVDRGDVRDLVEAHQ